MASEEDPDLELYGTSPGVIAFFMILISLVLPIGIIPFNAWMLFGFGYSNPDFMVYSLLWFYTPGLYIPFMMMPLFMLLNIWLTIPLTIFNIAYIKQIIRYYRGNCTRYSAIWVGILSITFPTVFSLSISSMFNPNGDLMIMGPIPLQFIAGLIFLVKIRGPEMTSPWRGNLQDNSWWRPKRPEWWNRMFPSSEEEENKESEPETKTEWLDTE